MRKQRSIKGSASYPSKFSKPMADVFNTEPNTLDELRSQIRNALVCDDREHLEDKDIEACYNCQIDKVLALFTEHSKEVAKLKTDKYDLNYTCHLNQFAGKCLCDCCIEVRKQYKRVNKLGDWSETKLSKRNKGEDNEL